MAVVIVGHDNSQDASLICTTCPADIRVGSGMLVPVVVTQAARLHERSCPGVGAD